MAKPGFPLMRMLRLNAISRRLTIAVASETAALVLLLLGQFVPLPVLPQVAFGLTGIGFLAAWAAVVHWRMPVFSRRALGALTLAWGLGVGLSVLLILASRETTHPLTWRLGAQWMAFCISLAVGGLQFRALFHRRATPWMARLLSLLSPMVMLTLIGILWLSD